MISPKNYFNAFAVSTIIIFAVQFLLSEWKYSKHVVKHFTLWIKFDVTFQVFCLYNCSGDKKESLQTNPTNRFNSILFITRK